jgi:putative ABC transporter-associated repeat protein
MVCSAAPLVAAQAPSTTEDPALEQQIGQDQQIATGPAVLSSGHVDIGPIVDGDEWRLMVHDDSVTPSVWRDPDDTVLQVGDAALVEVPDDETYAFLGAEPGKSVHVVSQTQQPDVVWVGWNTQHPRVMERIDRGVTLTMVGVEGPGQLTVYLQSGNFGAPEVLWSSAEDDDQSIWVDVNTHTHANWVFTEPGVYLVRVQAEAELRDGTTERAAADLRFAVGDGTDPDDALAAVASPSAETDTSNADASAQGTAAEPGAATDQGAAAGSNVAVLVIVGAGAVVLIGLVAVFAWHARRTRDEAATHVSGGTR